jgi:broad specificity phosphatase PhoE
VTSVILIRHAEPLVVHGARPAAWPLTERGRKDAHLLGESLLGALADPVVWASPERRAGETASLAFPRVQAVVRDQLSEVEKPWYGSADEHADAVARYLRGDQIRGWERRAGVLDRLGQLNSDIASVERPVLVTHGVLLTTWLDHQIGLADPASFWAEMEMPDAWAVDTDARSVHRIRWRRR